MLGNMLIGLSTMLLCLLLQLVLLLATLRYYQRNKSLLYTPSFADSLALVGGVMLLLVVGILMQIAIWGGVFIHLGEFTRFDEAFYHSAVNFATLGYGDIVMSEKHKLLGPLESINGVLMIGLATSVLMTSLQRGIRETLHARGKDGEL